MKKLRTLKLFEEFIETKNYTIRTFFTQKIQEINNWFVSGSFGTQNTKLLDLEQSNEDIGMVRTLKLDFEDSEFRYQIIILIDHTMVDEGKVKTCALTIKKYLLDENQLIDTKEDGELEVENLTEDYIINQITNLGTENTEEETQMQSQEEPVNEPVNEPEEKTQGESTEEKPEKTGF